MGLCDHAKGKWENNECSETTNVVEKRHSFYPLIIFKTTHFERNGKKVYTDRRIRKNRAFDDRWDADKLEILYGRQLGKLQSHKMKPLMGLPYSIEDCSSHLAEIERLEYEAKYCESLQRKSTPKTFDAEDIELNLDENEA